MSYSENYSVADLVEELRDRIAELEAIDYRLRGLIAATSQEAAAENIRAGLVARKFSMEELGAGARAAALGEVIGDLLAIFPGARKILAER